MDYDSPFARLAHRYAERGFSPVPIGPHSKVPGFRTRHMNKWQLYCETAADHRQIDSWIRREPEAGIGLACGYNDLVAVDVDNVKAYPAICQVFAGTHPPTKIGRKGASAFFWSEGVFIPSQKFYGKPFPNNEGKMIRSTLVEILALGNQTVIPDTVHPDTGKPYRWVHASLEEVRHPSDLPVLTQRMSWRKSSCLSWSA